MTEAVEFTLDQLTGRVRTHLRELKEPSCALHLEVLQPFLAMRAAAAADGIELVAFSSFRDFDRQPARMGVDGRCVCRIAVDRRAFARAAWA